MPVLVAQLVVSRISNLISMDCNKGVVRSNLGLATNFHRYSLLIVDLIRILTDTDESVLTLGTGKPLRSNLPRNSVHVL